MKLLYPLITAVSACFFLTHANAQITSWSITAQPNVPTCSMTLSLYVDCGPVASEPHPVSINWGNNTSTDYLLPEIPANSSGFLAMSMEWIYLTPAPHVITVDVFNPNSGSISGPQSLVYSANSDCAGMNIDVLHTQTMTTLPDVPFDFTDVNGAVYTIYPFFDFGTFLGIDPAGVPYTVSVNDAWLVTNGLAQLSPDFTIDTFDFLGPDPQMVYLECGNPVSDPDFTVQTVFPSGFVAPLQTGNLLIVIANQTCSDTSDFTVTVDFPQDFVPVVTSLTNASVNGNTLTYTATGYTGSQTLSVPFTFPGSTPAGTPIAFTVTLGHPDDLNPADNTLTGTGTVLNSYDPNEKLVDKPAMIDPGTTETLTYEIHFQNDGNMDALNITVRDTLSENLDLASFSVLASSHNMSASVDPYSREVIFSFPNIHLGPSSANLEASQGFVLYRINENSGLLSGDAIENTAYIYFDFNPAIVTNTTYNINTSLAIDEIACETITLYPNPATDAIRFNGADVLSAKVYDLAGKLVIGTAVNGNELSIGGLSNGVYQVQIATAKGVHTQKLVVKK